MTTYRKGANTEALTASAGRLKALRADLTQIESTSRAAMNSIESNWGGSNLSLLARDFTARALPSLRSCTHVLDQMASRLEQNSAAQRSASGLGGRPAGSGFGATAGGAGGGGTSVTSWGEGDDSPSTGGMGGGGGGVGSWSGPGDGPPTIGGKKHDWDGLKQDDSRGGEKGSQYTHRALGQRHTYTVSTEDGDKTYTSTGSHWGEAGSGRQPFERSDQTETAHQLPGQLRWLPTDNADDPDTFAKRHKLTDGAIDAVNWTETQDIGSASTYEQTMYDRDGNVTTNPDLAVRTVQGGGLGADASAESEAGIKDGALYAGATATAGAYLAKGSLQGTLGEHGRYKTEGFVGAQGKADAGVSLGKDGLKMQVGAEAFVGAKGSGEISGSYGVLDGQAKAEVMAGAEAKADASVGIGKDGLKAKAGVEAFAGAKAQGEVGGSIAGFGGTLGGEVYAGIGGHAKADINFSAESVKVNVDVGAALGIGAGVKFSVDIRPGEFIHDVGLDQAARVVQDLHQGVADGIANVARDSFSSIDGLAKSVRDPIGAIAGLFG